MFNSRDLKRTSKEIIKRRAMGIIIVAVLYILFSTIVNSLVAQLSGYSSYASEISDTLTVYAQRLSEVDDVDVYNAILDEMVNSLPEYSLPGITDILLMVLSLLAGQFLGIGYQYHALQESRGVATNYRSLFYAFNHPLKTLGIMLLSDLMLVPAAALFTLPGLLLQNNTLLVVGSLVAAVVEVMIMLRISFAYFVCFDNQDLSVIGCLKKSASLMRGKSMSLLRVSLSFLPWALLSSLVTSLVMLPIVDIWFYPYYHITRAKFYSQLTSPDIVF